MSYKLNEVVGSVHIIVLAGAFWAGICSLTLTDG